MITFLYLSVISSLLNMVDLITIRNMSLAAFSHGLGPAVKIKTKKVFRRHIPQCTIVPKVMERASAGRRSASVICRNLVHNQTFTPIKKERHLDENTGILVLVEGGGPVVAGPPGPGPTRWIQVAGLLEVRRCGRIH
jgi:hypothetical protein